MNNPVEGSKQYSIIYLLPTSYYYLLPTSYIKTMNRTILKILCLLFPIVIYLFPTAAYAAGEVTDCSSQKDLQDKINKGPGLITFNCVIGSNIIPVSGSQLSILNHDVSIDGRLSDGRVIILQGNGSTRVLNVETGRQVTLTNIVLANGFGVSGGALRVNKATLTVINSTIRDNKAGRGAGIFLIGSNLNLIKSSVTGNTATDSDGAGILITSNSRVTVTNGIFSSNSATKGQGAGIALISEYVETGSLYVENSTFTSNQAFSSTAIYVDRNGSGKSSVTISGSSTRFDSNIATGNGGAMGVRTRDKGNIELTINGSTFLNNKAATNGGGLAISLADTSQNNISLSNLNLSSNEVANNGGGLMLSLSGSSSNRILLEKSTVSNNKANNGGGIAMSVGVNGQVVINNSTLSSNSAVKEGGGIYIETPVDLGSGTAITVSNSTINDNSALTGDGGGLRTAGIFNKINVTVLNSTISGNKTNLSTDLGDGDGGGASISKGIATFINTTIAYNTAKNRGGGLRLESSGVVTIQNTILAINSAPTGKDCYFFAGMNSAGYNLIQSTPNCNVAIKTGDIFGKDPLLAPLADNGGGTRTHAFSSNSSPAIDAIKSATAFCPPTDQRGKTRPIDVSNFDKPWCDMGAYESMPYTLDISKVVRPTVVSPNGLLTYTLYYTVSGIRMARNVTLRDTLPAHVAIQSIDSPGQVVGAVVVWALGDLTPPATGSVNMVVKTDLPLPNGLAITNTATISSDQFITPTNFVTALAVISSATTFQLNKSVTPTIVEQDGLVTYTLVYTVQGNAPTTNIILRDEVPANTTFFRASVGPDGLTPSQPLLGEGSGAVVWKLGNLNPNTPKTGQVQMTVRAKSFFIGGAKIINTASITSAEKSTPEFATVTSLANAPDLTIDKSTSTPVVFTDQPVTYTMVINNNGSLAATGVKITDLLPEGFAYRATTNITWTGSVSRANATNPSLNSTQPSWGSWTIPPNGRLTIVFNAHVSRTLKTGIYNNKVKLEANETSAFNDGTSSKNEDVFVNNILNKLIIEKRTSTPNILGGDQAVYWISFRNSSSSTLTSVVLSDTLPSGFVYHGLNNLEESSVVRADAFSQTAGMTQLQWGRWQFNPGGIVNITFTVDVPKSVAAGLYNNTVLAYSDQTGQLMNDGNVNKEENVVVSQKPVLYINKRTTTPIVTAGDLATYTIAVLNGGTSSATGVVISDVLPSGFRYQDSSFETISATRLITTNPLVGDRQPSWRFWSIDPAGALTITFRVKVPDNAPDYTYNNWAFASSYETEQIEDHPTLSGDKDTIHGQDTADDEDVTVGYVPFLTLNQQFDNPIVGAGGAVLYHLTVTNLGTDKASGVGVMVALPVGFSYAAPVSIEESNAIRLTSSNPKIGDTSLAWDKWVIAPKGSVKISFFIRAATTIAEGVYTTNATVQSDNGALVFNSATLQVHYLPVLQLNKKTTTPYVLVGEVATYTVVVSNVGTMPATGVVITDLLPSGGFTYRDTVQFEEISATRTITRQPVDSNAPAWGSWTIEPNGALRLTFQVDILGFTRAGTYHNTIQTASNETAPVDDDGMVGGDADTPPNEDPFDDEAVTVTSLPMLSLSKDTTTPNVNAGEVATYTLEVRNLGTSDATEVVITDTLPNGFSYLATTSLVETATTRLNSLQPTAGETSLTWGNWTIERNGYIKLAFMVSVSASLETDAYKNVAWVSSHETTSINAETYVLVNKIIPPKQNFVYLPLILKTLAVIPTDTPPTTGTPHTPTPTHTPLPPTDTPTRSPTATPSKPTPTALAPDLVVERIEASSQEVVVVIRNQGDAPVDLGQEFWVDLYVAPNPPPTKVNQIWNDGRSKEGIVWGVTASALPLKPGGMVVLTYKPGTQNNPYVVEKFTKFFANYAADTPIYVQVDSANISTTYGGVLETHEITGAPYNNISKAVFVVTAQTVAPSSAESTADIDVPHGLPPRP